MRLLIAFFFSLCLVLNAAYAAGTDVCDALEAGGNASVSGLSEHGGHLGHHVHDHEPAPDTDAKSGPADSGVQPFHGDHCHPHQCFTSVLPGQLTMPGPAGRDLLPMAAADDLFSQALSRLERPPRATLA